MSERPAPGYAGLGQRLGAALLDLFIFSIAAQLLVLIVNGYSHLLLDVEPLPRGFADVIFIGLVLFGLPACWRYLRGSPGKLLLGCCVVDAVTMQPISYRQGLRRVLGYVLSALALGFGFWRIAWDARRQGWHDQLASTVVVSEAQLALDGGDDRKPLAQLLREVH